MLGRIKLLRSLEGPHDVPWLVCYVYCVNDPLRKICELLFTHIEKDDWGDLWYIDLAIEDSPGIIDQITEVLRSVGIQIMAFHAAPSGRFLIARFTITARGYESANDGCHFDRIGHERVGLKDLQRFLEASFLHKLRFENGKPILAISRNSALARLTYNDNTRYLPHARALSVEHSSAAIPGDIIDQVTLWIAKVHGLSVADLRSPLVARCDDDTGDFFKLTVAYCETGMVSMDRYFRRVDMSESGLTSLLRTNGYDIIVGHIASLHEHSTLRAAVMLRDLECRKVPADPVRLAARLAHVLDIERNEAA